jgi:hypothetical protein
MIIFVAFIIVAVAVSYDVILPLLTQSEKIGFYETSVMLKSKINLPKNIENNEFSKNDFSLPNGATEFYNKLYPKVEGQRQYIVTRESFKKYTAEILQSGRLKTTEKIGAYNVTDINDAKLVYNIKSSTYTRFFVKLIIGLKSLDLASVNIPTIPEYQFSVSDMPQNTVGNTNGNILNGGLVSFQGSRIYINGKRLDLKSDSSKSLVTGAESDLIVPSQINIVGDYMYFVNIGKANEKGIYKMRIDGKYRTIVTFGEAECMIVAGEWIYYVSLRDNRNLYKIKTDGTFKTKLTNEAINKFNFMNGYIYYSTQKPVNSYSIYKISVDSDAKQTITIKDEISQFCVEDNCIYYTSKGNLYRIDLDGSNQMLIKQGISAFNINGNYVYYNNGESSIRRITIVKDAVYEDKEIFNASNMKVYASVGNIYIAENYIIFTGFHDDRGIYKIKNDGSGFSNALD